MTYQSTFSDMITRLRNGQNIRKLEISIKYSKECINILKMLYPIYKFFLTHFYAKYFAKK